MKFFEVLSRFRQYENKLWSVNQQLRELSETLGIPRTKEIVIHSQSSSGDSAVVAYLDRISELKSKKADLEETLDNLRNDLERFLNKLEDCWTRQTVELRLLYHRNSWKRIASRLNYSQSTVRRLYKEGLNELEAMEL